MGLLDGNVDRRLSAALNSSAFLAEMGFRKAKVRCSRRRGQMGPLDVKAANGVTEEGGLLAETRTDRRT